MSNKEPKNSIQLLKRNIRNSLKQSDMIVNFYDHIRDSRIRKYLNKSYQKVVQIKPSYIRKQYRAAMAIQPEEFAIDDLAEYSGQSGHPVRSKSAT